MNGRTYRLIKNERVPGPKWAENETTVAPGLTWEEATRLMRKMDAEVRKNAKPGETSWTLPVFYRQLEGEQGHLF